jgi:PAS domain S-box-containing protein
MGRKVSVPSSAEAPYESLLAGSLQGVLIVGAGEVLLANAAAAALLGAAEPAALHGLALTRLFAAEDARRLLRAWPRRAATGAAAEPRRLSASLRTLGGGALPVEVCALPIPWGGAQALQLTLLERADPAALHAERDALRTERDALRGGQEALRAERDESRAAFRHIIDGSLQGIYVHDQHRFLFCNQTFADIFGYDGPEQVLALGDVLQCYALPERERLRGYYQARVGGGRPPVRYEFQGLRKDGSTIWLENQVRVVNWQGQQAILATVIDISERKRAEQELQASEEKYRNVVESTMQAVLIQRDRRALFVNQAFLRLFGFDSAEEVYALESLSVLIAEDDRERLRTYAQARLRGEAAPERYIGHALRRDGSELWVDTDARAVNWQGQRAIQVTAIDVTDRVRAERELDAQRRLLETVFDAIPHPVYVKDRDQRYRMANRALCEALLLDPREVIGRRLDAISALEPTLHAEINAADTRVLESGQAQELHDVAVIHPNGLPGRLNLIKCPLRDEHGHVIGVVGITEDVTERHAAAERLRASERLMRMVFNQLPHLVFVKDREGRYQFVNTAFAAFHGLREEDIVGKQVSNLPVGTVQDTATFLATDRRVMEQGQVVDEPELILTPVGGAPHPYHLQKLPLLDESGAIVGLVGLAQDITARIQAQQELRDSQRLLRTVIDTLPHAVYVKDRQGCFRIANTLTGVYFHRSLDEIIGRTQHEMGGEWTEDKQAVEEADRLVMESGRPIELPEMRLCDADGHTSIRRVVKIPLQDDRGEVTGVVGISEDITERKRVEEELRTSRLLLQSVINLLPLWVFVKDKQRRFQMVNRQMAEDYDIGPDVEPGALIDLGTTITEEERSVIYQLDQRVLDTGERIEVPEVQITLPRGGTRLFRTVRMPLQDAEGAVAGIVGIAEDITERRRTEQAMQQAQKLESLGVLAGGIAHDFNNLLVSILGNASLALLDLSPEAAAKAPLLQIETAGQRAAELCRQMLAYSGKGSFEIASVNLNALIQEMTQLLHVSLARQIQLSCDFEPALPSVEMDPTQIRQVVMNLVLNAAEAIGERAGHVSLRTAVVQADRAVLSGFIQGDRLPEGRYVCLEVSDTGSGIALDTLGRIFDPFFTTKFAGRGLGLAAVLGIVRGHDGAMQVQSVPDVGSTFRMLLPARSGQPTAAQAASGSGPGPDWRGAGVALVVDDDAEVREVLARMLDTLGFQVLAAADGSAALERLRRHGEAVRLVVLDLTMPGLDGEQTLQRLRRMQAALPALIVTGVADRDVQERFAALGAAAVLQKPFTLQGLAERLRALLG